MARPRIFISSTYYDLKHIRNSIENFITDFGYEPVLFESGDIPFKQDLSLDESCYMEIENSHMQILIIGGRYGSKVSKSDEKLEISKESMYQFYNSITKIEYKTAIDKGIPIYIFVEKQVLAEYDTFKNNRENESIIYAHVDSTNIFKLIDEIHAQRTGNFIRGFERFEDISSWLRDQWAGLFTDYLKNSKNNIEIRSLSTKINELGSITNALKEYTEAIMRKIQPENYERLITEEDERIEIEKALRFQNEPLIKYLIDDGRVKESSLNIYNYFKNSKTLDEFLSKINMKETIRQQINTSNRTYAEKDFNEFKMVYQNIRNK